MSNRNRRAFGQITPMRSGRYQARYTGPDGNLHTAPSTFEDRDAAVIWLDRERRACEQPESWQPPRTRGAAGRLTFNEYADLWLAQRKVKGRPLQARTRDNYRALLDRHLSPTFGGLALASITRDAVDRWYDRCAVGHPTTRAHAYSLLRTIMATAVTDGRIPSNPAQVRGGGSTERLKTIRPASLEELEQIVAAMPEAHRLMVLLAAWCALRFGELAELRRGDVDTKSGVLRIRRSVVRSKSEGVLTKAPKSAAGTRDVAIPPHLLPTIREHLLAHAAPGKNGLLFATSEGDHLAHSSFYGRAAVLTRNGNVKRAGWGWREARRAAGREDLRFHDLRHTGAVLAAQTGATLAELMARLGHTTPAAAMRYQHAAADRDQEIARRLSAMVGGSDG